MGKDAQKVRRGDEPSGDRGQQCGAEPTTQHISGGHIVHDWKARPRQKGWRRFWGGCAAADEGPPCPDREVGMSPPGHTDDARALGPLAVCRLDSGV